MAGWWIRKRPLPIDDVQAADDELLYGRKVPRLEGFSEGIQGLGAIVLELKLKYPCTTHHGEHGDPGVCFIGASGEHLGLNNRKLKMWATAIAAHDCTKHAPPNTIEFDGVRDGRSTDSKPRGRSGPNSASTSSDSTAALLLAAMIPLLTNYQPVAAPQVVPVAAPVPLPVNPALIAVASPLLPPPELGMELHECLLDFKLVKGIDITGCEKALSELDITPDIVSQIPASRLSEVMGVVEGKVWKFRVFADSWGVTLVERRQHHSQAVPAI